MGTIRILLADDHPVVILGACNVLNGDPRYLVVGQAANASELVSMARELAPDVIITDYNMPGGSHGDGLSLVQYLRRHFPLTRLLIYTMITSPVIVASLYDAGVSGVLFKNRDQAEILSALDALAANRVFRAVRADRAVADPSVPADAADRIGSLSAKEIEVLRLFLSGTSVGDIARIMNRSVKTISTHKISAMRKLNVETDHELVMFGVSNDVFGEG